MTLKTTLFLESIFDFSSQSFQVRFIHPKEFVWCITNIATIKAPDVRSLNSVNLFPIESSIKMFPAKTGDRAQNLNTILFAGCNKSDFHKDTVGQVG